MWIITGMFSTIQYFSDNATMNQQLDTIDSLNVIAKNSKTKLDSIHQAIISLDKMKFSDLSLADAIALLSEEYLSLKTEFTEVVSKGQSGGVTAETVDDTYQVESKNQSGGITAGQVDININPEKPKLVPLPMRSKVEIIDEEYEKKFYFHNPEGLLLRDVYLKVTFDKEFTSVKGDKWVWTGAIARGSERTHPEPTSKSMMFYTAVLEPIAFIEITVTSKHDIQIKDVDFETQ